MSHHINFDTSDRDKIQFTAKNHKTESKVAKKREMKKLEIDNKQMEWRLHQLKLAMEKEKEEREKKSFIWQSGKDGALESHARNILGRTVKSKSAPHTDTKKKTDSRRTKVKVLFDEPLELPKRKSHSKDLIDKLKIPMPPKKPPKPGSPVEVINKECWISIGIDRFSDDVMEIQSDRQGNLPLETLQGLNPVAIGLYYMRYGRKRLLLAIDNKVIQPKTGWGNDVYYPYVANISPQRNIADQALPSSSTLLTNQSENQENNHFAADQPLSREIFKSQMSESKLMNGNLLDGVFDEEANALAFQQAVDAWRNGNNSTSENLPLKSHKNSSSSNVKMAVHDVQSEPVKQPEITFSETSTLTYMEKILLQKHRKTDIPALPKFNSQIDGDCSTEYEQILTAAELEEKERYREIFSPLPSHLADSTAAERSVITISEVEEADDFLDFNANDMEPNTYCYVEEASDTEESLPNVTKHIDFTEMKETPSDLIVQEHLPSKPYNVVTRNQISTSNHSAVLVAEQNSSLFNTSKEQKHSVASGIAADHSESATVVQAIGNFPLNPDAMYKTNLEDYYLNMQQERNRLYQSLDQDPQTLLTCKQSNSSWSMPDQSPVFSTRGFAKGSSGNVTTSEAESVILEQEQDDCEALEKLEWELASETGNITSEGRISRLIDDWSSDGDDKDLEIKNDPGFGSGLSTPDPEPITLVGTSLSWQDDSQMLQEFQRMEDLMLVNDNSNSGSRNSDSQDF